MTVHEYTVPRSLPEALDLLAARGPDLLVIAGGTIAMPLINEGISLPEAVMGLRHAGLGGIDVTADMLRIGATATLTRLLEPDAVEMLSEAARNTAAWSVRNMATVGGNLFTPPPGGDVAVALLALDAVVVLASSRGERTMPLAEFFTGFLTTAIADDELLVELRVPLTAPSTASTAFLKLGRKHANTPSVVTVAVRLDWDGASIADARIALGAVGPHPIRALRAEQLLRGTSLDRASIAAAAAAAAAAAECEPATDGIASAWYRRRMCELQVGRALGRARDARKGGR